ALTLKAKDSRLMAEYGRAFLAGGDRKRAEETFERAVALDWKDGETYRLVALAWLHNGFKAEALKAHRQMLEADPKADRPQKLAAIDLLEAGLLPEAEAMMAHVQQIAPKDTDNLKDFALAAFRAGLGDLGTRWAERAWEADPKGLPRDWHDCFDLGLAARKAGLADLAARWFARAAAADPKEERMWNALALAYADAGRSGSATR
ncbi:MAG TPA: hypothetical protein VF804_08210, partial [Holophagaceae bacterium]